MPDDAAPIDAPAEEIAPPAPPPARPPSYGFSYRDLPAVAQASFNGLTEPQRAIFADEYTRHKKDTVGAYVCWFLLGCHYAFLGKWGVQVVFWISCFLVIGWLWWLIDLVRIPGMVKMHNQDAAVAAMQAVKTLGV